MTDEDTRMWRIGELAASSGLSVRALRHYDELGLLTPAERTASGYLRTRPSIPRAHARELVAQFTGGEPDMAASLGRMWGTGDPAALSRGGVDPELIAYSRQVFGAGDGLR
jgi:hypothetical protein